MEGKNLPGWVPNLNGLSPTYQEIGKLRKIAVLHMDKLNLLCPLNFIRIRPNISHLQAGWEIDQRP